MREEIFKAKTVEEAIAAARAKYADSGEELSFEILELPKRGFLGIGAAPASVKVTIGSAAEDELEQIKKIVKSAKDPLAESRNDRHDRDHRDHIENHPQPEKKQGQNQQSSEKKARPEQAKQNAPKNDALKSEKSEKPVKSEHPAKPQQEEKPAKTEKIEKAEKAEISTVPVENAAPAAEGTSRRRRNRIGEGEEIVITAEELQVALDFINRLLKNMEIDAVAVPETAEEGKIARRINIIGDGAGSLIGHHGETLDAIQYLANLAANRRTGSDQREYVKIAVDIEGYREKREETLRALARRMASRAIKYKKNMVLEPMNPYERRIIHSEIQNIENVDTHSVGSDDNRKIVITYTGPDAAPRAERSEGGSRERSGRRGGRGRGRGRGDRGGRDVKAAKAADASENASPVSDANAEAAEMLFKSAMEDGE